MPLCGNDDRKRMYAGIVGKRAASFMKISVYRITNTFTFIYNKYRYLMYVRFT